jgi:hypothetical protein
MNRVDAEKPIRKKRTPRRNERCAGGQGVIQGIQKEYLPWPSVF